MSSLSSSPWARRGGVIVCTAGAAALVGALRSKSIGRQAAQNPYILDPSLPVPNDVQPDS